VGGGLKTFQKGRKESYRGLSPTVAEKKQIVIEKLLGK